MVDTKPVLISKSLFPTLLLSLTLFLYWPSLRIFFSVDELRFLLRAAGLEETPFRLTRLISVQLFFKLTWELFGNRAFLYHLVILILHAANAWIVYLLARRLNFRETAAVAASILFLATPVAFLPMHWISGIQEVSMTFFALIAAYFFLGRGYLSMIVSLMAAGLSLLCKESSCFLLPGLAVIIRAPQKRKWILGIGGILLGLTILVMSGRFTPRPSGDPYEAAAGINVLWNLLTYTAWLIRFWDIFPDRIPLYQENLAIWGLILPFSLCIIAWRVPKTRRSIARASLLFILFLAPVLPLIRHSYFYYLYLPLIPFWLLAGSSIGNLSKRRFMPALLVLFIFYSSIYGSLHRRSEIKEGVLADPILRYAAIANRAIKALRATGEIHKGNYIFTKPFSEISIDLAEGLQGRTGSHRKRVHFFKQALLDGRALRLFFPDIQSVYFEEASGAVPGWQNMYIYGTYGLAEIIYLGYGEDGRMKIVSDAMAIGLYDRAEREIDIVLELHPDNPSYLFIKGQITLQRGDMKEFYDVIEKLEVIANNEIATGSANRALNDLKRMAGLN
jgi:hypothetical protein